MIKWLLNKLQGTEKKKLILQMLYDEWQMRGLDMIKLSKGKLKRGSIYVYLHRLEDAGYIFSLVELPGKRRVYYLTHKCRKSIDKNGVNEVLK